MRTDVIGPRTWLLVSVAGGALLVWVLALLGLGGQIRPLPSDSALEAVLPKLPPKTIERLGPLNQYPDIASQPIFSPNRQPQSFFISGDGKEAIQTFDFILTSVLLTPEFKMAILQPTAGGESVRLKVGDAPPAAPGWRLSAVNPRSAMFDGPDGQNTLELRAFDGTGGQASGAAPRALRAESPVSVMPTGSAAPNRSTSPSGSPKVTQVVPATEAAVMPATATPATGAAEPVLTTEQQMDVIRKRIEERRAQLRSQGASPSLPNKTK